MIDIAIKRISAEPLIAIESSKAFIVVLALASLALSAFLRALPFLYAKPNVEGSHT